MSAPATPSASPGDDDPTQRCEPDVIDDILCRARNRAENVRAEWHAPAAEVVAAMLEGKYDQVTFLDRGGMAAVYRGRQIKLNINVAIKLPGLRLRSEEDLDRFRREARHLTELTDERIVRIYDYDEVGGIPYYTMELVEGRTLLHSGLKLTTEQKLRIGISLCRVLAYVHGKGVIHRDIKPDNIMLLAEEKIKLMDFGISCMSDGLAGFTRMGTQDFQSPEQALGTGVSSSSDLYSLGMTLWWLFTGQSRQRPMDPGTTSAFASQVPPEVMEVLTTACKLQPVDRFPNVQAMEKELERILVNVIPRTQPQQAESSAPESSPPPAPKAQPPPIPSTAPTIAATAPPFPVSAPPQSPPKPQPKQQPQSSPGLWQRWKGQLIPGVFRFHLDWVQCFIQCFIWAAIIGVVAWNIGLINALYLAAAVRIFLFTRVPLRLRQVGVGIVALFWLGWAFLPVSPNGATADRPFVNSLGMSFVPLPGTQVLIAVRPTEAQAYHKFFDEQSALWDRSWLTFSHANSKTDSARHVSWLEADAFVKWLSLREGRHYRLQTSLEWEQAVAPAGPIYGDAKSPSTSFSWLEEDDSSKPNKLGIEPLNGSDWEWCENGEDVVAKPGNSLGVNAGAKLSIHWVRTGDSKPGGRALVFRTTSMDSDRAPLYSMMKNSAITKHSASPVPAKGAQSSSVPDAAYVMHYTFRCVLDLDPPTPATTTSSTTAPPGPGVSPGNKM
jgi:serine/threonine protein kinase